MGCIVVKSKQTNNNGKANYYNLSANKIKSNQIKPNTQTIPKIINEGLAENINRENSEKGKINSPSKIIPNENKVYYILRLIFFFKK